MQVKRDLRTSRTLPVFMHGSETWNETEQTEVRALELSYLRATCGFMRMAGVGSE